MKHNGGGGGGTTEQGRWTHPACMASHFRISCQACSLFLLWIFMMLVMSSAASSSSRQRHLQHKAQVQTRLSAAAVSLQCVRWRSWAVWTHPFRSMAFQNICSDGYTQFFSVL